ncbi:N-acetyl-alpha-D-glucosaminyl L-malate synthase [Camellia lanceoleosa]|uniref:N-acetyl-alpha-D-glucosaminyl L-malate synthase n=1 Tax=Camellia lanceoleosa TaxID=1840588 RepID=A0ACC0FDA3_9ERIC|nr:N-acetyl-alpha-D-glucosaminyl L-malate synthase [Camellia lanceoleosa]
MEEGDNRGDLLGNVVRPSSLRTSSNLKITLSGKSTPRGSPPFRRLNSSRTPRREGRSSGSSAQWFRSNRLVLWLLLITLWAYAGFYVQSRWAHGERKEGFFGRGSKPNDGNSDSEEIHRRGMIANDTSLEVKTGNDKNQSTLKNIDVVLAKKENVVPSRRIVKKKSKRSGRGSRSKTHGKQKATADVKATEIEEQEPEIPKRNTSYGLLVGPFGSTEDRILEWSPEKRSGSCDRRAEFARRVWSRKFLLIFHELSMTGAPLSMMELATELLSCGATVSAVVVSKKGGLMPELVRRRIKILDDRSNLSFKTAMKADLVIAGSAVCSSWIEQYIAHFPAGSSHIAWWIMENRREYFDRSKLILNQVKMLVFLSESQSKQWQAWCAEENINLNSQLAVVPLSVNDELAFVAGIACSLNTPSFGTEKMLEKRRILRNAVREEMGLKDSDMLVMTLSSINAGKGQLLLLESAHMLLEQESSNNDKIIKLVSETESEGMQEQTLKVLIGSVGSKSNKVLYVKAMLSFLSQHSNLSKSVLWTPATTRVASLYSAADVYVINSQGLGETFGRVTIEAMAFGLPVLGTDAGGTKDIVEHNVTGLLYPLGRPGVQVLSEKIQFLLKNPSMRQEMGMRGRKKVEKMYLKRHMYKKFAEVLFRCMRIK